jgi:hypothetical protein
VLYIFDDDGDLLSQSHYMDVDEGWKRLVTVHDRALHSPSQPIIRVPQHLLATTTTHMTHVFTDSELLVGGSPGETSRYAQSLAERLVWDYSAYMVKTAACHQAPTSTPPTSMAEQSAASLLVAQKSLWVRLCETLAY